MILKELIERCEKYQEKGCESCQWRDGLKQCLYEIVDDYNSTVSDDLQLDIIDKDLYRRLVKAIRSINDVKGELNEDN